MMQIYAFPQNYNNRQLLIPMKVFPADKIATRNINRKKIEDHCTLLVNIGSPRKSSGRN